MQTRLYNGCKSVYGHNERFAASLSTYYVFLSRIELLKGINPYVHILYTVRAINPLWALKKFSKDSHKCSFRF